MYNYPITLSIKAARHTLAWLSRACMRYTYFCAPHSGEETLLNYIAPVRRGHCSLFTNDEHISEYSG